MIWGFDDFEPKSCGEVRAANVHHCARPALAPGRFAGYGRAGESSGRRL